MLTARPILVQMRGIVKRFPGTVALDVVDFDLERGEVHCLVGENGAGKSTLMKVLAGVYKKDEGRILLEDEPVEISNPTESRQLGINVVYQELELIPSLSVAENIFIGNEVLGKRGFIDWPRTERAADEVLRSLGIELDVRGLVENLSVAQQQLVTIAKAVSRESRVIIMDEPSAVLSGKSLDLLFRTVHQLKDKDIGVVYISHHLGEIHEIGDRVTILKDAKVVRTSRIDEISLDEIIRGMIGRKLQDFFFKKEVPIGDPVLSVKGLEQGRTLRGVSFELREREILGIFGLIGAGRTELARAIIGADPVDRVEILLRREAVKLSTPEKALAYRVGYLSENRRESGLLMERTIGENIVLPVLKRFRRFWWLNFSGLVKEATEQVKRLRIKPGSLGFGIANLSGGNQQKVVFAKWLGAGCDILILDEPTRGIDVGTKEEIYHLVGDLVAQGKSIILISSELPEIMALSDRILIMNEGAIVREAKPEDLTQEEILKLAIPSSLTRADAAEDSIARRNGTA